MIRTFLALALFWSTSALGFACELSIQELPHEARATLALIKAGGPFPYRQDGRVFHNRERLLPAKPSGYYREYTVRSPGSRDRGPRRIVAGRAHEYYYTEDHYRSFRIIRNSTASR